MWGAGSGWQRHDSPRTSSDCEGLDATSLSVCSILGFLGRGWQLTEEVAGPPGAEHCHPGRNRGGR